MHVISANKEIRQVPPPTAPLPQAYSTPPAAYSTSTAACGTRAADGTLIYSLIYTLPSAARAWRETRGRAALSPPLE